MAKKLIIETCDDCCHFDYYYYSYNERCEKLNRVIKQDENYNFAIPEDCPLEDV